MPILSALGGGSAKGFGGGSGPHPTGEAVFFTLGTTNWTVPKGVRYISVLAVGAGGAGGEIRSSSTDSGGGGALAWANEIRVSSSSTVEVFVGNTISTGPGSYSRGGEDSYVRVDDTDVVRAGGGNTNFTGGAVLVGTGYSGGSGASYYSKGGGGAAGYSANGGSEASAGTGGSGAGGGYGRQSNSPTTVYSTYRRYEGGAGGGGVGLYGGSGDVPASIYGAFGGQGGSLQVEQTHADTGLLIRATGLSGQNGHSTSSGVGGFPGGGGGSSARFYRVWADGSRSPYDYYYPSALGAPGAIRIIYGPDRLFPASDIGLRQDGGMELFDT